MKTNAMPVPLTMCCPRCRGRGKVALPLHLKRAYKYLQQHGPSSAGQLHKALTLESGLVRGITSANNWLTQLEELGLVRRLPDPVRGSIMWAATAPEDAA